MFERDVENRIGHHIALLSHRIQNRYNQKLAEFDLTAAQARVLYLLSHYGSQTQVNLQKRLYIKGSTMNGIIESLLKKKCIQKVNSIEDKRAKVIHLTQAGKQVEESLWKETDVFEHELMSRFTKEETALLLSWLRKIEDNLECEGRSAQS
ncbi:MarR family winged helix-turn-helix transcriptional regulator [Bacillus sp. FJAT-45037]|uniref:MarR family winged helix-turn-helix transcriptional regulator n=1 Tax=Bacillus sp. FJAT-45037 TaxID=2011007 RepID=UPI000C23928E|nr:MarR family transcriptional regulator [Bacillus sp. FJAT-45037]